MAAALLSGLMWAAVPLTVGAQQVVNINWGDVVRPMKTTPTFQVVVNPLTTRSSPIHDEVYAAIAALNASMVRYVPWLPYPRLGVAALEAPSGDALCGFRNEESPTFPLTLDCGSAGVIKSVSFASFGNPSGVCGALKQGTCSSPASLSVVQAACVGKPSCTLVSSVAFFGGVDPCPGTAKHLSVQVTCSLPGNHTYWDFKYLDEGMEDFMAAQNNGTGKTSVVINFSTPPNWLYVNPGRQLFPDDPQGETWSYEQGTTLVDTSGRQFGDYYGRLVAHYTDGGFTDEYGVFQSSPYHYTIGVWENLNEVEAEHSNSPESYTIIYDQMVAGIKRQAPKGAANMKARG